MHEKTCHIDEVPVEALPSAFLLLVSHVGVDLDQGEEEKVPSEASEDGPTANGIMV